MVSHVSVFFLWRTDHVYPSVVIRESGLATCKRSREAQHPVHFGVVPNIDGDSFMFSLAAFLSPVINQ